MSVYLIAYDLINERDKHDYKPLWAEFTRLDAHRVQDSLWLISLSDTVVQVRDHFKEFIDSDDKLWVTKIRKNQYTWTKANGGTNDWLKANPPEV